MNVPKPTLLPAAMPFSSAKTATMKLQSNSVILPRNENKTKHDFQLFSDIFKYFQIFSTNIRIYLIISSLLCKKK